MLIDFVEPFFHKNKLNKKPGSIHFFPFRMTHDCTSCESKFMPLVKSNPCLSRKENTSFFPFSRGTPMPLAKANPCLSWKRKNNPFVSFPRGMSVAPAKANPHLSQKTRVFFCFLEARSRKQSHASRIRKIYASCGRIKTRFFMKKLIFFPKVKKDRLKINKLK